MLLEVWRLEDNLEVGSLSAFTWAPGIGHQIVCAHTCDNLPKVLRPLCGFQGSDLGHQTEQQAPLSTQPSKQPMSVFLSEQLEVEN